MEGRVRIGLPRSGLAAVLVLSVAMLAFQILQATVLGLQLFPEAGFLAVAVSMLGLGSGGSVAVILSRRPRRDSPLAALPAIALAFGITVVLGTAVASRSHAVGVIVVVGLLPYVCAGLFFARAFAASPEGATTTYGFDLVGAALGCVLVVLLLDRLGDAGLVCLVLGALGALAAVLAAIAWAPHRVPIAVAVGVGLLALAPLRGTLFRFDPEPLKFYGKLLTKGDAGGRLARQQWNHLGRIDAVVPGPAIGEFEFTKEVTQLLDAGCDFRLLFSNGYNWTWVVDFGAEQTLRRTYFDRWAQHLPYAFLDRPAVLNLGAGGGVDMYFGALHDARTITGVEINPLMIEAARDWHPGGWDGLWQRPGTRLVALDARTFVNTTPETFDVITLNAVDTGGAQASLLSANFLYTTEAFGSYLRLLRPGGAIFLTRPRDQLLRSLTAAVAALRAAGHPEPARHVVVVGPGELLSATVFADPLSPERVEALASRIAGGEFMGTAQYLPGRSRAPNPFSAYFDAVSTGHEGELIAAAPTLIAPTTDDEPYFYQLERPFRRSGAWRLLRTILLVVLGVGVVMIFVPLLGLPVPHARLLVAGNLVYFALLGVGFMLAEISLVTKLALLLGHPARSLSVTIASLLLASGLGSLCAGRLAGSGRHPLRAALALAALLLLGWAPLLDAVVGRPLESAVGRSAVVVALLAPLGFVLGMPFPLKLRTLQGALEPLVPWAWAVNGFASVAGSVLAVALAMNVGFRNVFLTAALCYALALVVHRVTPQPPT